MANAKTNKSNGPGSATATNKTLEETYEQFTKKREETESAGREEAHALDKWLLTLSSGALVFSWTLFKDIALKGGASGDIWLTLAWLVLVVAIMTSMFSLYASVRASEAYVRILDKVWMDRRENSAQGFWDHAHRAQKKCLWVKWINWPNRISLLCFLAGLSFLCYFAYSNFPSPGVE